MPEFIMPFGDVAAIKSFNALDEFCQGYVEAMFFTSSGYQEDEDLEDATFDELHAETIARIERDCEAFQTANAALLDEAYQRDYTPEQAGRDYWLTRNGHGAGFWDRSELQEGGLGDKLSNACRYSEVTLYRGDDNALYLA